MFYTFEGELVVARVQPLQLRHPHEALRKRLQRVINRSSNFETSIRLQNIATTPKEMLWIRKESSAQLLSILEKVEIDCERATDHQAPPTLRQLLDMLSVATVSQAPSGRSIFEIWEQSGWISVRKHKFIVVSPMKLVDLRCTRTLLNERSSFLRLASL